MRKDLNIFVEPETGKPLVLKVKKMKGDHILTGMLVGKSKKYPIVDGIPRFVKRSYYKKKSVSSDELQTAVSFGKKWREKRNQNLGETPADIKNLREQFLAVLGCHTVGQAKGILKKAKRILNAGCGVAWSEYLFNYNPRAERHSIDFSLSVEVAYGQTKNFSNTIISQASVFDLPYRDRTFDIIFSIGVLHHTPDPAGAFKALARKLAPGGLIGVYIYCKKPFLRELADRKIREITTHMSYDECMQFSKQVTQFGKSFNAIHQSIKIKKDIDLLGIKKGTYSFQRFVYDHFIKCWYNPNTDDSYADIVNQDWYHPFYASHHKLDEILSWFKKAGCKKIKVLQPKGWEHSGYFVSGRKK